MWFSIKGGMILISVMENLCEILNSVAMFMFCLIINIASFYENNESGEK